MPPDSRRTPAKLVVEAFWQFFVDHRLPGSAAGRDSRGALENLPAATSGFQASGGYGTIRAGNTVAVLFAGFKPSRDEPAATAHLVLG